MLTVAGLAGADTPQGLLTEITCVGNAGSAGCDNGWVLDNPQGVAASKDGTRVLATAHNSNALAVFTRSARSFAQYPGNENRNACTSEDGSGPCQDGHAFVGPMDVVVTNDSNSVYVASTGSNAIDILAKDQGSRQWEQDPGTDGCISQGGAGGCTAGHGLAGATSVAINPTTSNFVYVGGDHSIAAFRRNAQSGELTQLPAGSSSLPSDSGCVNDDGSDTCANGFVPGNVVSMAFSSDGKFLYAAVSGSPGAVLIFSRAPQGPLTFVGCVNDDGSGGCVDGTDLVDPTGVAVEPNKKQVYVTSHGSGAVTIFGRDTVTGLLTQLGGTMFVANVNKVAVATNGKQAYATTDAGIVSFNRSKKTGALTQADCLTDSGGCTAPPGHGIAGAQGLVPTGGGKNIFVAGSADDAVVLLRHS
jgi:DNA-binding beta-propeller fold protein YncE